MEIRTQCQACQGQLSFALEQAGATGPCFHCSALVTVPAPPPITSVCSGCGTPSLFAATMLGQSGPCRACGQPMVVASATAAHPAPAHPAPANAALAHSAPANTAYPEVAPERPQQKALGAIEKEVGKAGFSILSMKVVQIGAQVTGGEAMSDALKARFMPFGASIRTDRVMALQLRAPLGTFLVCVPFSGKLMLAHELASLVPGTLPSNLWLERGLMGSWGDGHFTASQGDDDPVALAAADDSSLNEGIEWDWERGNTKMKLGWGLQAVAASATQTLHVVHTAQRGIVFKDFGLVWYQERRRAFSEFVGNYESPAPPAAPRFRDEPLSTIFAAALFG